MMVMMAAVAVDWHLGFKLKVDRLRCQLAARAAGRRWGREGSQSTHYFYCAPNARINMQFWRKKFLLVCFVGVSHLGGGQNRLPGD